MYNRLKTILASYPETKTYLLFLGISIAAYWQIAFLQYSVQWDMLDCFLPWRYFVGESLQSGNLPFWNPYQHLGYPIHADLRSAWYPEMFIIGLTTGYTNITFHLLFIFYLSIAGYGMFKLSLQFASERKIAFIIGLAYMLSGFFVGHGQDIGYIIGGVFPPWVIAYYLRYNKQPNMLNLLRLSLIILLMVMGAYPSFTIFTVYILFALFIFFLIPKFKTEKKEITRFVAHHFLLLIIIIAGSLVLILTLPQVVSWVSRMGGMPYEMALKNPFTPQSLLSWFVPFANVNSNEFFKTDVSMNNAYWGLLMMVFFLFSFFKKKRKFDWLFIAIGIFSLFASFGDYSPLHKWLYMFVPGMDRFRMPSFFSLFTIITFLIIASSGIKTLFDDLSKYKKLFSKVLISFLLLMIGVFVFAVLKINYAELNILNIDNLFGFSRKTSFYEHIAFHSFIQIVILFALKIWLGNFSSKETFLKIVTVFVFVEMFISVQLNIYYTVVNHFDPITCNNEFKLHPKGFPVPSIKPVDLNTELASKQMPLWRNVNIYTKRIGIDGFNSFNLDNYQFLFDSLPDLKNVVLQNTLVYLSDRLFPLSLINKKQVAELNKLDIYISDSIYKRLESKELKHLKSDKATITSFEPNEVQIAVSSNSQQVLTILQSDYIGWKTYIDGAEVPHFTSNVLFKSVIVPAGNHKVVFKYKNNILRVGFVISYSVLILLCLIIILLHFRNLLITDKTKAGVFIIFVSSLIIIFGVLAIIKHLQIKQRKQDNQQLQTEISEIAKTIHIDSVLYCLNVMNPSEWGMNNRNYSFFRFNDEQDIAYFYNVIDTTKANMIVFANEIMNKPSAIEDIILLKYPHLRKSISWDNANVQVYDKNGDNEQVVLIENILNFEETGNKILQLDSVAISSLSFPYEKVFGFDEKRKWGPGFSLSLKENYENSSIRISLTTDALFDNKTDAFLVLEIKRGDKQLSWDGIKFEDFYTGNKWQKIVFSKIPAFELERGDELKVYVWNVNESSFDIDNLALKVTKEN